MIREKTEKQIIIDLAGPQGNAFYLLGTAKKFCQTVKLSKRRNWKTFKRYEIIWLWKFTESFWWQFRLFCNFREVNIN